MRKWWGLALGSIVVAAAVQACVGDAPATSEDGDGGGSSDATTGGDGSAGGDGSSGGDSSTGDSGGDAGPTIPASCQGLPATCSSLANQDCCLSGFVDGGTFYRNYDGILDAGGIVYNDMSHTAILSSFKLDAFAVTVGRFRKFVDSYPTDVPTTNGVGKNPHNGTDPGWSTTNFNPQMPTTQTALKAALVNAGTCGSFSTWTDTPDGGPEQMPINCVTWYEAFAFCIWDGGRLPTAAEYNYAESGGSEQRVYPWSSPSTSQLINPSYVIEGPSPPQVLHEVGSKLLGNGKYGQSDLVGNMAQWTLDSAPGAAEVPPASCNDCASFGGPDNVLRGSAWPEYGPNSARSSRGQATGPGNRSYEYGFRCARDL